MTALEGSGGGSSKTSVPTQSVAQSSSVEASSVETASASIVDDPVATSATSRPSTELIETPELTTGPTAKEPATAVASLGNGTTTPATSSLASPVSPITTPVVSQSLTDEQAQTIASNTVNIADIENSPSSSTARQK